MSQRVGSFPYSAQADMSALKDYQRARRAASASLDLAIWTVIVLMC